MEEKASSPLEPLGVKWIHHLVRLMKRYDLTALDLVDGSVQIRLRRRGSEPVAPPAATSAHPATASSAATSAASLPPAASRPEQPPAAPVPASKTIVIESPMVGTYYASSAPGAPPYVSVGSVVHPDTIVGIIEAMKVFTDIPAGVSGTIVEIVATNAQPVEFGQPLFRVIPV
jgi:acetyl-CoA carboxylase biotin carboxyl carrier protein